MIALNLTPNNPVFSEPKRMIIVSQFKVGKTSLLMQLPNAFIVDGEDSMGHFKGCPGFNVIKEYASGKHTKQVPVIDPLTKEQLVKDGKKVFRTVKLSKTELIMNEVPASIRSLNDKNGGIPVFEFIIVETLTVIEELARGLATLNYKRTTIGKSFKGTDIIMEGNSPIGYDYLRKAVEQILNAYEGLAKKCFILTAHIKDASIMKKDESIVMGREMAATGKLKTILPAKYDATGYLLRSATNENTLSFVTSENDKSTGARNPHLTGREIIISRFDPTTKELTTYWEEVFPSILHKT